MDQSDKPRKERTAAQIRAVYATKFKNDNTPAQIEEGLYLGSFGAAYNKSHLKSLNVTHILTVANSLPPAYPHDFTYKIVDVFDRPEVNIAQFFDDCFNFIHEGKRIGGVLVHCYAGISRSVTVVLAFLMKKYAMSLSEAMNIVKSKRSVASPNSGFMLQLQNYMKYLRAMTLRDCRHYPGGRSAFPTVHDGVLLSLRSPSVPINKLRVQHWGTISDKLPNEEIGLEDEVAASVDAPHRDTGLSADPLPRKAIAPPDSPGVSIKGKEVVVPSSSGVKRRKVDVVGGSFEEMGEVDPYVPGDNEAALSRDILSNLPHPKVQRRLDGLSSSELADFHDVSMLRMAMSGRMLSKDVRSLSEDVVRLRGEIVDLNNQRVDAALERSRLESELDALKKSLVDREGPVVRNLQAENARLVKDLSSLREFSQLLESAKKVIEDDSEALRSKCRSKCRGFEEKEATFQATEASLLSEVKSLKDKLGLALDERAFVVTDVLPHVVKKLLSSDSFRVVVADLHKKAMLVGRSQALQEVIDMDLGLDPKALKDFDPDATKAFENVVDDFKHLEYPYLDMLAYHSRKSPGFLLSLEPPSLPIKRSCGAGPSKSPAL